MSATTDIAPSVLLTPDAKATRRDTEARIIKIMCEAEPLLLSGQIKATVREVLISAGNPPVLVDRALAAITDPDTGSVPARRDSWPSPPDPAAYYGLAGKIVDTIEPHTEADPVALLVQLLVFFGNAVGRGPHFTVEADRHGVNEFALLVGDTAKGRKGTSAGYIKRMLAEVDGVWHDTRIKTGLSTGEGLKWHIRDPIFKADDEGGQACVDHGETDKRLLALESEFASALRVIERQGNTLSAAVRCLWDSGRVDSLTKNDPVRVTNGHVSIVGHITRDELTRYLTATESGNGFANRFMFLAVRRSKVLPEGGNLDPAKLAPLVERLADAVEFAREAGELRRDSAAREIWIKVYADLSEGKRGLLGAVLSRAEAHVMRLACLYALLDQTVTIGAAHLRAALALWEYCEESAAFVFGEGLGDSDADTILRQLRLHPEGMSRTDINGLFARHRASADIERALALLRDAGKAKLESRDTGGRPVELWTAT